PPVGTAQLVWLKTGVNQNVTWGYSIYSGVNQATPFGTAAQAGATGDSGGPKSVAVATASGDLVVDAAVFNAASVPPTAPVAGECAASPIRGGRAEDDKCSTPCSTSPDVPVQTDGARTWRSVQ